MSDTIQIIKYEGDNTTFVWKHPCEDFNNMTQLVVHESQEALFFMNGQILDTFTSGRYTLNSENIPKIGKLLNRLSNNEPPFHCEVYFVNKTEQMSIKWGTNDKVQYIDAKYGFPISIGASGVMSLSVDDGKRLLLKLVGTESLLSQEILVDYFRAILNTRIKTYIAQYMKNNAISIFEIDENLTVFSDILKELLTPDFLEYGLNLERFFVTTIVKPDGNKQYEQFKELHFRKYADIEEAQIKQKADLIYAQTEAQKMIIASQALSTKRKQEGYTYQQEKGFEVASKVAENEAVGQISNLGVGLGAMAGVGASVGGLVGNSVSEAFNSTKNNEVYCENCGEKNTGEDVFCSNCGHVFTKPGKFCPKCGAKRG